MESVNALGKFCFISFPSKGSQVQRERTQAWESGDPGADYSSITYCWVVLAQAASLFKPLSSMPTLRGSYGIRKWYYAFNSQPSAWYLTTGRF